GSLGQDTSGPINEQATQLVITTQPPLSVTAGAGFGLVVKAEDAFGNLDQTYNGTVTAKLANNPGGSGTTFTQVSVPISGGIATFPSTGNGSLSLNKVGTGYTFSLSANGLVPLAGTTTGLVSVTPSTAQSLAVSSPPPGSVAAGSGFGITVSAQDQ